ncbi:Cloroperoxidase [Rhizoctonia solani]|nr:Cloroperoxidase [Rhizoctonia solani]
MDAVPGHEFQAPTPEDSRSPCPALNAAANHNYLPHSGKNLGFFELCKAVHELYGLSYPLAAVLSLGGILLCGSKGKLDLAQLAKHNRIEHDGSLAHEDLADGDNKNVSPRLVEELVGDSTDGKALSFHDLARARVRREIRPLDKVHSRFARAESVLSVMIMGDGKQISCDSVKTWMGEERLPSGWTAQQSTVRLVQGIQVLVD